MDLFMVLLLFMSVILILVDGTYGHPKSWLTTTTKRPRTKPKRRPKRSLVNWDVTFHPRLTAEYKDKIEALGKLLQEEREDAKGEENDMMLSLLQGEEKQEPATKAPKELGFKKRVVIQLKSPKQGTSGDAKFLEGHPVFEPRLGHPRTENYKLLNMESVEKIPELKGETNQLAQGTSNVHYIPYDIIERLLSEKSASQPNDGRKKTELQSPVDNTLGNYQNHYDTNANFIPQLQENRENRYQVPLQHLLNQQNPISEQLLNFLRNEEQNWEYRYEKKDESANEKGESANENYDIDDVRVEGEDGSDERMDGA